MSNTSSFYWKAKQFQDKRAALTAEYDKKAKELERYKGSAGYGDEMRALKDKLDADLKALAAEYRPGLYEDMRLMREAIAKRPIKAPTSDQVNLLNVLKMRKDITREELERAAATMKDNPIALSVVNEIAREHGIVRAFEGDELSSERASEIVDILKTGIEDFLHYDTQRVSRMAQEYHDHQYGKTGNMLMKRRSFNDREAFYRDEIGLSHDTLQKFADIVDS